MHALAHLCSPPLTRAVTHHQLAFAGFRHARLHAGALYISTSAYPEAALHHVASPEPLSHLAAVKQTAHPPGSREWCLLLLGVSGSVYIAYPGAPMSITPPLHHGAGDDRAIAPLTAPVIDLQPLGRHRSAALLLEDGRIVIVRWARGAFDVQDVRALERPMHALASSNDSYSLVAVAADRSSRRSHVRCLELANDPPTTHLRTTIDGNYHSFHYAGTELFGMDGHGVWHALARGFYAARHLHEFAVTNVTDIAPYTTFDYSTGYCRMRIRCDRRLALGRHLLEIEVGADGALLPRVIPGRRHDMALSDSENEDTDEEIRRRLEIVEAVRECTLTAMRDYYEVLLLRAADGRAFCLHLEPEVNRVVGFGELEVPDAG